MPTTTKMGIAYPASTDLVKDGATNMGTIATTVDAKTGLVLISTTTFSAVSQQIVTNCFSSLYKNYRVLVNIDSVSSTGAAVYSLRFGTSGTPNTNADYSMKGVYVDAASATFLLLDNGTSAYIATTPAATTNEVIAQFDVINPFATAYTYWQGTGSGARGYSNLRYNSYTGEFEGTTSFTDLVILPSANNITGTIQVFGYNQ
jgi:hypothetical protein